MVDPESTGPLSDEELDKYGFVMGSPRRRSVVIELYECPETPKEIAEQTDISLSHISNVLGDLVDEEIAVCVNPDRKRGRVYRLTETGNRVAAKVLD